MSTQVLPSGVGGGGGTPASTVVPTSAFGQASSVGTSTDYARADHTHGSPAAPNFVQSDGWFGHGVDGDLTVSGATNLTRDSFYNNLTITATGVLKPVGYRLFVLGTLTIEAGGALHDDGASATGTSGGAGLGQRGPMNVTSGAGGSGGNASVGGAGGNTTACTVNTSFVLPTGGAGGSVSGLAGGAAGAATQYNTLTSMNVPWVCLTAGFNFARGSSASPMNGGAGGGGGASGAGGAFGGGGGSGGGGMFIACKTINNAGRISVNGGNGANASGSPSGVAGGGGGGAGGYVVVMYQNVTGSGLGTIQSQGGTGGTPIGAGNPGNPGNAGFAVSLKVG